MTESSDQIGVDGGSVSDRIRVLVGAAAGALVGGIVAYFVFTPRGRDQVAQVNPTLDELSGTVLEFRRAVRRVRDVADEAFGALEDVRAVLSGGDLAAKVSK